MTGQFPGDQGLVAPGMSCKYMIRFSVSGQFPGDQGLVAPGMSCKYMIRFSVCDRSVPGRSGSSSSRYEL